MKSGKLFAGLVMIPRIGLIKRMVQIREIFGYLIKFPHLKKCFINMHYISKNGIFEVVIIYNSQANDIK